MKRIYLIDCPGVVPPNSNDSEQDILLRGVVRVENVENPHVYIPAVLKKTKPQHIERTYDVRGFNNATEFLELLARKAGRLLKGGEADVDGVAKMVLNDFLRGKIPWFTAPPLLEGQEEKKTGIEGRKGALGEMGRKRKAEDAFTEGETMAMLGESISNEEVPEDLVDPVIAEPATSEIIRENIPNGGSDFESFDEDDNDETEGDSDVVPDEEEDEANESDTGQGGTSLLELEDFMGDGLDELDEDDASEDDATDDGPTEDGGEDGEAVTGIEDAANLLLEEAPMSTKRKRKD